MSIVLNRVERYIIRTKNNTLKCKITLYNNIVTHRCKFLITLHTRKTYFIEKIRKIMKMLLHDHNVSSKTIRAFLQSKVILFIIDGAYHFIRNFKYRHFNVFTNIPGDIIRNM